VRAGADCVEVGGWVVEWITVVGKREVDSAHVLVCRRLWLANPWLADVRGGVIGGVESSVEEDMLDKGRVRRVRGKEE
jgi:hypothetical protein